MAQLLLVTLVGVACAVGASGDAVVYRTHGRAGWGPRPPYIDSSGQALGSRLQAIDTGCPSTERYGRQDVDATVQRRILAAAANSSDCCCGVFDMPAKPCGGVLRQYWLYDQKPDGMWTNYDGILSGNDRSIFHPPNAVVNVTSPNGTVTPLAFAGNGPEDWYFLDVPPGLSAFVIDTCGAPASFPGANAFDTVLAVFNSCPRQYQGLPPTAMPQGSLVAYNDDAGAAYPGGCPAWLAANGWSATANATQSLVKVNKPLPGRYWIMIDGLNVFDFGTYSIFVTYFANTGASPTPTATVTPAVPTPAPCCDRCNNQTVPLVGNSGSVAVDLYNKSNIITYSETTLAGTFSFVGGDVVYMLDLPVGASWLNLTTCGNSTVDTLLAVFTSCPYVAGIVTVGGGLIARGDDDVNCTSNKFASTVRLADIPAGRYYILVDTLELTNVYAPFNFSYVVVPGPVANPIFLPRARAPDCPFTPLPSRLPSLSPTPSTSATPSTTISGTPTNSKSATVSRTKTSAPSPTSSVTVSVTGTGTTTRSASATASVTVTLSRTRSSSPAASVTVTASASATGSSTSTVTQTPSSSRSSAASVTPSPTGTASVSPSPTGTASVSPSPTGTASVSPSSLPLPTPAGTASGLAASSSGTTSSSQVTQSLLPPSITPPAALVTLTSASLPSPTLGGVSATPPAPCASASPAAGTFSVASVALLIANKRLPSIDAALAALAPMEGGTTPACTLRRVAARLAGVEPTNVILRASVDAYFNDTWTPGVTIDASLNNCSCGASIYASTCTAGGPPSPTAWEGGSNVVPLGTAYSNAGTLLQINALLPATASVADATKRLLMLNGAALGTVCNAVPNQLQRMFQAFFYYALPATDVGGYLTIASAAQTLEFAGLDPLAWQPSAAAASPSLTSAASRASTAASAAVFASSMTLAPASAAATPAGTAAHSSSSLPPPLPPAQSSQRLGGSVTPPLPLPSNAATAPSSTCYDSISLGGFHGLALSRNTTVAFGESAAGQGDVPAALSGLVLSAAAGGFHSCALHRLSSSSLSTSVTCWGGVGSGAASVPPGVAADGTLVAVAAGGYHTCAVARNGSLACWGANGAGQSSPLPAQLAGGVASVAAGAYHTCAVAAGSGAVACWGRDAEGQVSGVPSALAAGTAGPGVHITCGGYHCCAWGSSLSAPVCWGSSTAGQTSLPTSTPASAWSSLCAGGRFSCGLASSGRVTCWGSSTKGETAVPPAAAANGSTVAIACGWYSACALLASGSFTCWGSSMAAEAAAAATAVDAVVSTGSTLGASNGSLASGAVLVFSGAAGAGGSGAVSITTGAASGGGGASGAIVLQTGAGGADTRRGAISLVAPAVVVSGQLRLGATTLTEATLQALLAAVATPTPSLSPSRLPVAASASPSSACPPDWLAVDGTMCYRVTTSIQAWVDGAAACRALHPLAALAEFDTLAQAQHLRVACGTHTAAVYPTWALGAACDATYAAGGFFAGTGNAGRTGGWAWVSGRSPALLRALPAGFWANTPNYEPNNYAGRGEWCLAVGACTSPAGTGFNDLACTDTASSSLPACCGIELAALTAATATPPAPAPT